LITVTVDASISLGLVLRDEDPVAFRGLLEAAVTGDVLLVTAPHWPLEVGNGLLGAVRRKRIGMGDAERAYARLLGLPIVVRPHVPFEDVLARAATDELSVYDAAYLSIAIRDRSSLATTDRRLAAAAAVHGLLFTSHT
jgi:predicted nucleic acid-binding protein